MTNNRSDGQLGQQDIIINDDPIYRACMEWDAARAANAGAAAKLKRLKNTKDAVLGALDLSPTEAQRFVIRPEADPLPDEPLQYAINVKPPGEPSVVEEYSITPNHSVTLIVVDPQ